MNGSGYHISISGMENSLKEFCCKDEQRNGMCRGEVKSSVCAFVLEWELLVTVCLVYMLIGLI